MVGHVRNRFHWDKAAAGEMLHFGKWIFVSTLITFFALQIDRLLLGKVSGLGMLGVYTIALTVATMPRDFSVSLLEQVLYPLLAEKARQGHEQMKQTLDKARRVVLPFALFSLLGVALGAELFFTYLYKWEYHDAGWIAQWLCFSVWLTVLRASVDRALLAMGDSRTQAASELAKFVATAASCLLGYHLWQLKGFIVGLTIGALAGHVVVVCQLVRHGIARIGEDVRYTVSLVALGVAGVAAPRLIQTHLWPKASLLVLTLVVAAAILGATGLWVAARLRCDLWSIDRRVA
jgi:O-antigen/teichoic acid export membrane protein